MRRLAASFLLALGTASAIVPIVGTADAEVASMVILNGGATPVYYNDGDTFRVLEGSLQGTSARLAGFNTLESYGPVHKWKDWTYKELYVNAKMATLNARRGVWSCEADLDEKDGYGRVLAKCLDLAEDQIRKGYAHALSVDGPAHPRLIKAQREAIVNKRGMWAKGVPALVMTSLHSVDERPNNEGNYNRLVSPTDGYSTKWKHQDTYTECQEVCVPTKELTRGSSFAVLRALRADRVAAPIIRGMEDPYLVAVLNEYATNDRLSQVFPPAALPKLKARIDALKARGDVWRTADVPGSCMVHVIFERRYRAKPECLKW